MDTIKDFFLDIENWFSDNGLLGEVILKAIIIILTIILTIITLRIINKIINYKMGKTKKQYKSIYILFKMLSRFIVFVIAFTIIIAQFDVLNSLASTILAASGIAALAVGIAAQDSLSNIIGGVSVTLNNKIEIGDFIRVVDKDLKGTVEEITLRHTILRNLNSRMVLIPNKTMASSVIENYSNNEEVCYFLDVGISYDSNIDLAMDLIKNAINDHKDTYMPAGMTKENYPKIKVTNFGSSSIDLRAWVWVDDPSKAFDNVCDLRKTIKHSFDENGIEIPYKYSNIIIKSDTTNTLK